ncbi:unnamed protein product [Cochlearia groenlandica]
MKGSGGDGGGSSASRVSIPENLRETIESIREITGKQHSDEDIYAVYKDSFNDPHETAQKLLYLDTFHEVTSKREKKKEASFCFVTVFSIDIILHNPCNTVLCCLQNFVPINQASGRGGPRNFASTNNYQDAGNGRSASFKRDSGANHGSRGPRTSLHATNKERDHKVPREIKVSGPNSLPNGASNHKAQDGFSATVNKGLAEQNPLSKSTSSSENAAEPETTKAISAVRNHIEDVTSPRVSQPVLNNQPAELKSSTFAGQDPSFVSASHCSNQSDPVIEHETASYKGKAQSLLKADAGERSHVTFPIHLQVAELLQNGLMFGSFDSNFVKESSSNDGASGSDDLYIESIHGTKGDDGSSSLPTNGIASVREGASSVLEDKDHGISDSVHGANLVRHSDHIVLDVEDELKEEALTNTQTHQIAYGQEAPFTVFGLVPASALGHPTNTEQAETQPRNFNAPALSYPPDQFSIAAASQQLTHLFRQQYPHNFYPYGPYYSPFYMPPPYMHQFLSPNGIPQQSYFPPGAALAAPTHITPLGDIENPPTTNPSSHASSTVDTHIPSATALNSIHSEAQTSPMTESAAAWIGHGLGNLQVNPMYNLAMQGQPHGFPVVQPGHNGLMGLGIHQQSHPMAAPSTTYQTLTPPQHTTAMAEPVGHSHIAYQQPQAALPNGVDNY